MPTGIRVSRVSPGDFEAIYSQLLVRLDPRRPVEEFRRIFEYAWLRPEDYVGLALYDGPRVVGYLGLIFSEIPVDGRRERLCNVTSLIADERYRAETSLLILRLRTLREYTVTNLTCNDVAYQLFTRLGFTVLDDRRVILYPPLRSLSLRRPPAYTVLHDPASIRPRLGTDLQQILDDHLPYTEHLLASSEGHSCYVVFTVGRRRGVPTARLSFISAPAVFADAWPAVQRALWRRYRTICAECDARLLGGYTVPGSRNVAMTIPRLYQPSQLRPARVPNLYSELTLLNLP